MDLHDVRNGNYHLSAAAARKKKCWKNWRGLIRGTGLKPGAKTGKQTTKCNPLSLSLDQHQQTLEFCNFDIIDVCLLSSIFGQDPYLDLLLIETAY